jgi:hypothetical protein
MSQGLTFLGYFTWMKVMTDVGAQYPLDRKSGIGVDSSSVPAVFGFTWSYEFPFGQGRKFSVSANRIAQKLVSGWTMNGFMRYQSGFPLGVSTSNTLSALGYSRRANYVGGQMKKDTNPREFEPATSRCLNAAAFGIPDQWSFGNLAPALDWLRGFTSKAESVQFGKLTKISERVGLTLTLDLSNPFNFHRWRNPSTTITDSLNFGRVTSAIEGRTTQITAKITF